MLLAPVPDAHHFAVYSGSYELDLTTEPEPPQALFADLMLAVAYGARKWPSTFKVVDLSELHP